jgi:hypothetical protein
MKRHKYRGTYKKRRMILAQNGQELIQLARWYLNLKPKGSEVRRLQLVFSFPRLRRRKRVGRAGVRVRAMLGKKLN